VKPARIPDYIEKFGDGDNRDFSSPLSATLSAGVSTAPLATQYNINQYTRLIIDPVTGLDIDPSNGYLIPQRNDDNESIKSYNINPITNNIIDPASGLDINSTTGLLIPASVVSDPGANIVTDSGAIVVTDPGAATAAGLPTGGATTGGATTGGAVTGGATTGGAVTGGPTGGATTGGAVTGGATTGGAVTGGAVTGGATTGGAITGGAVTGGAVTGGATTGGATTGGATTGGATTGGATTGGAITGGAVTGGATTGGAVTGGAVLPATLRSAPLYNINGIPQQAGLQALPKIPQRNCNIYYTNNTDLCDEGLYNRTLSQNKDYRSKLMKKINRTNYDETLIEKLNIVIADQEHGNIDQCKVSFDEWMEPAYNLEDNTPIPLKNAVNKSLNSLGDLSTWAKCYKKAAGSADPNVIANDFIKSSQLGGDVSNYTVVNSPFNDSNTYAGLSFNTFNFTNKCLNTNTYKTADVPDCILAFIIEDNRLRSIVPAKFNKERGQYRALPDSDALIVLQKMMRTVNYNNNMYLVSKAFNAMNYVFEYDSCGRVKSVISKKPFTLELNVDINDYNLLYVFDDDFEHKTYESIINHRDRVKNNRQKFDKYNRILDNLNNEIQSKTTNILNQLYDRMIDDVISDTDTISMYDQTIYSINPTAPQNTSIFYAYTYNFLQDVEENDSYNYDDDSIEQFKNKSSEDIHLVDAELDITNSNLKKNTPLKVIRSVVQYSISLYIKIDGVSDAWRNIFYHGNGQADNTMSGAVPSLSIKPNTSVLYFRHPSVNNPNNGCDLRMVIADVGKWFHFSIVVNDNLISLYYNGVLVQRSTDSSNVTNGTFDKFVWPDSLSGLDFYINYYNYKYNVISKSNTGSIKIKDLIWYNRILNEKEIRKMGSNINKLNNVERSQLSYDSMYSMITPFTFTAASTTGPFGPTYDTAIQFYNLNYTNNYAQWINNTMLYSVNNGIQYWTVPRNGFYNIIAAGACGSSTTNITTGRGAIISSYFELNKGQKIALVIGQYSNNGAGGGTFIIDVATGAPLLIAGGGGSGTGYISQTQDASYTTTGNPGTSNNGTGQNGSGGPVGSVPNCKNGSGGGGFISDGVGINGSQGLGYFSTNGPIGGVYRDPTNQQQTLIQRNAGGFGGGAGGTIDSTIYFGGGGYSGGGGGSSCDGYRGAGGGGGSYDSTTVQNNNAGIPYTTDGYDGYNNKDVKVPYLNIATNGSGFVTIQNIF